MTGCNLVLGDPVSSPLPVVFVTLNETEEV
jgi:hypothetical protein